MSVPNQLDDGRRRIRLWPGIAAVILQWTLMFVLPSILPDLGIYVLLGGFAGGAAMVLIWWLFFSREPKIDRWVVLLLIAIGVLVTPPLLDKSIVTGMMGMMFYLYAVPVLCLALVLGATLGSRLSDKPRRAILAAAIYLGCGFFTLVRTDGMTGEGHSQFAWRWAKSSEQRLLAKSVNEPLAPAFVTKVEISPAPPAVPGAADPAPLESTVAKTSAPARDAAMRESVPVRAPAAVKSAPPATHTIIWPGFRGANRDDVISGVRIATDWAKSPPVQLWRRSVGPGWSSFAVGDGLIYTQEQRGDFEVVAAYHESTGEPVWIHRDAARFWESNGGAGPRGTPALRDGRIYTFGATGILNALDASDGHLIWSRNAGEDTKTKVPEWGFASSPLVVDDELIVATAGQLIAYNLVTGKPRWMGPERGGGYSSPQLLTIGGAPQIVLLNSGGSISVSPSDGKLLWKNSWPGFTMLQPTLADDASVLVTSGDQGGGLGTRRLKIAQGPDGWSAQEVWTSANLKPYFNDIVADKGYAYGFDGGILACIDLQDGKRKWKGGRYGHGQLLLLADQDLLIVTTEEGEIALVAAKPDQFSELARIPAIDGKTWNHPVLARDTLLVRNGQEMAAFRLPLEDK